MTVLGLKPVFAGQEFSTDLRPFFAARGCPLNYRERLFKAVNNEPTDRPPLICPGGMMTMAVREAMELLDCAWPAAHSDASHSWPG